MKWTIIIILIFGLTACSNRTDKDVVNEEAKTIRTDSLYIDNSEINGSSGQPFKEFHNCDFDNFIKDKKTPKLAKDIYLGKNWNLNKDNEALALLDSLTAHIKSSRPFYFKVVTMTYKKSDGYFSEGLGLAGKEYVENNTKEFISYFDNKDCFSDDDLTTWANIVILELGIGGEGEYDNSIVDNYIRKLKSNHKDWSPAQEDNIDKFSFILKKEWTEFLKILDSFKSDNGPGEFSG